MPSIAYFFRVNLFLIYNLMPTILLLLSKLSIRIILILEVSINKKNLNDTKQINKRKTF